MKLIEKMSDQIEEEICDARKYIECALKLKENYQQISKMYYDLANEEIKHAEKIHEAVMELIEDYKEQHDAPPSHMMYVYQYLHDKHVDREQEVKILIGSY